jgi:hypothetical protein
VVTNSGSSKWIRAVHLLGNNDGSYLVRPVLDLFSCSAPPPISPLFLTVIIVISCATL